MPLVLDSVPAIPPYDSQIWGAGELINTVQLERLFDDSKTFVDLRLRRPEREILVDFANLPREPSREVLMNFVAENFDLQKNLEFQDWDPEDWAERPRYLEEIREKPLLHVGMEINRLWKVLSWKCSEDLRRNPSSYSKLYLPNGFVIPGGRFREIYYWDTYWIVRGLLISDMRETTRGILDNFFHQIRLFGHVPNGTRKYYCRRSQPPFLTSMMSKYHEVTGDEVFLCEHVADLERELAFFWDKRSRQYEFAGSRYRVFHYGADCRGPRPESYAEDVDAAGHFETDDGKQEFYLHVKAATESGWDFSSRWIINRGVHVHCLCSIKTSYIAPVDLNALMYKNHMHMADFYKVLENSEKRREHLSKAHSVLRTLSNLLWDSEENMWFDWDMLNDKRRKFFYASNLFPLWAEAYPHKLRDTVGKCAAYYLLRTGALKHEGGIPASLQHTGHQWDYNAWPPLQHVIVSGLNKTKNRHAQKLAFKIARNYTISTVSSCRKGCACQIFEKYNPAEIGAAGGGGEYEVQKGFGWTNGVLVDFITMYGDDLINEEERQPRKVVGVYGIRGKEKYSKTEPPPRKSQEEPTATNSSPPVKV